MTDIPLSMPSGDTSADDGVRPRRAVVASLRRMNEGALRLAFDDAISLRDDNGALWKSDNFYTHFSASLESVQEMTVSDDLLRDIGFALIARLSVEFEREDSKGPGAA